FPMHVRTAALIFAFAISALTGCASPDSVEQAQAESNLTDPGSPDPTTSCMGNCSPALMRAIFASPLRVYGVTGLERAPTIRELIAKRLSEGLSLSVMMEASDSPEIHRV